MTISKKVLGFAIVIIFIVILGLSVAVTALVNKPATVSQPYSTTATPAPEAAPTPKAPAPTPTQNQNMISQDEVNQEIQRVFPTIRSIRGEGRSYSSYPTASFETVARGEAGRLKFLSAESAAKELYSRLRTAFPGAAIGRVEENRGGIMHHYVIFLNLDSSGRLILYFIEPRTGNGNRMAVCPNPVKTIEID